MRDTQNSVSTETLDNAKITGHLDAAVYEQYNKKHQNDLRSAAQKRAEYLAHAV
jgi:hypothetical protein